MRAEVPRSQKDAIKLLQPIAQRIQDGVRERDAVPYDNLPTEHSLEKAVGKLGRLYCYRAHAAEMRNQIRHVVVTGDVCRAALGDRVPRGRTLSNLGIALGMQAALDGLRNGEVSQEGMCALVGNALQDALLGQHLPTENHRKKVGDLAHQGDPVPSAAGDTPPVGIQRKKTGQQEVGGTIPERVDKERRSLLPENLTTMQEITDLTELSFNTIKSHQWRHSLEFKSQSLPSGVEIGMKAVFLAEDWRPYLTKRGLWDQFVQRKKEQAR